jgi:uncharacterized protein (TIGR02147 family)
MTKESSPKIVVYEYLDYRAFLRDYYAQSKAERGLTFRGFSVRAGLNSPNYLQLVMGGKRNLTSQMAARFAKALNLDRDASDYFVELVNFNQSKSNPEREASFGRLTGFRSYRLARPLDIAQADYHSFWYIPAVRELVANRSFRDDPVWISRSLMPRITPDEAAHALRVLLDLQLLCRDENGKFHQSETLVSTGAEAKGVHISRYHRVMMERASASIDLVPAADRDISSLTLCLGSAGLRMLKERIARFRKEILELSVLETAPSQVIQVNFQLFPLSLDVSSPKRSTGSRLITKRKESAS